MIKLLLTGVGGFIGHHVAQWILDKTDWHVTGIDSWHPNHKGDRARIGPELQPYLDNGRLRLLSADLSVPFSQTMGGLLQPAIEDYGCEWFDYIINMASDSHVTRSIGDPETCWLNNTKLIYTMLEYARDARPKKFIQISTDEVYGDAGWEGDGHPEWDTILPSNPYSASKAAQEALCIAYWRTYNLPIVITNTMNVIGERQDPEKYLPMTIAKILRGEPCTIHGDGPDRVASRVWLDAKNMADALLHILQQPGPAMYDNGAGAERPDRYNVCGETEMDVLTLARITAKIMGRDFKYNLVRGDTVRPGYDRRYALDGTKLREAGWSAPFSFEETLERVIQWTLQHPEWTVTNK